MATRKKGETYEVVNPATEVIGKASKASSLDVTESSKVS